MFANARAVSPGYRFPAMWGPNFDWIPDQDHGSVMLKALQCMAMQCDGDKIVVLPAWPTDWNVSFKLHAPHQTTVEAKVVNGTVVWLKVTPPERRKDLTVCAPFKLSAAP